MRCHSQQGCHLATHPSRQRANYLRHLLRSLRKACLLSCLKSHPELHQRYPHMESNLVTCILCSLCLRSLSISRNRRPYPIRLPHQEPQQADRLGRVRRWPGANVSRVLMTCFRLPQLRERAAHQTLLLQPSRLIRLQCKHLAVLLPSLYLATSHLKVPSLPCIWARKVPIGNCTPTILTRSTDLRTHTRSSIQTTLPICVLLRRMSNAPTLAQPIVLQPPSNLRTRSLRRIARSVVPTALSRTLLERSHLLPQHPRATAHRRDPAAYSSSLSLDLSVAPQHLQRTRMFLLTDSVEVWAMVGNAVLASVVVQARDKRMTPRLLGRAWLIAKPLALI